MAGNNKHSLHGITQPKTGMQYVPRNQQGDDVDMRQRDPSGTSTTEPNEDEDNNKQPERDIEPVTIDNNIQEFVLKESDLVCEGSGNKINRLTYLLSGEVVLVRKPIIRHLQINSNQTERYLSVQLNDDRSKEYLLNLAFNTVPEQDTDANQEKPKIARFELYTEDQQQENRGRQIEITSLKPGTTARDIKGAFTPYGPVEHVRLALNKFGDLVAATVTFETEEPVKEMQQLNQTVRFIGKDTGRITRLGNTDIVYHKELTRKLSGIPKYWTVPDLQGLCKEGGCSVTVPFHRNSTFRKREAFFSFTSKEAFERTTRADFCEGPNVLRWVSVDTKLCNWCGSPDHLIATCPERAQQKELEARRVAQHRPAKVAIPLTTNKNRYSGPVPKAQTATQSTHIGPAYNTITKSKEQENNKQHKGGKPNQVSVAQGDKPTYDELWNMIQKQNATIKALQDANEARAAAENREKKEKENTEKQQQEITERTPSLEKRIAEAVKEAMGELMIQSRGELFFATKMLKEDLTLVTERNTQEEKGRKQPPRVR